MIFTTCTNEQIPGGDIGDCTVLRGVMLNKDVTHSRMRRRIENPRILLLDCSLEYKKGESQTNVEITKEEDFNKILQMEEEYIEKMCVDIAAFKPDLVMTEKGVSGFLLSIFKNTNIVPFALFLSTQICPLHFNDSLSLSFLSLYQIWHSTTSTSLISLQFVDSEKLTITALHV